MRPCTHRREVLGKSPHLTHRSWSTVNTPSAYATADDEPPISGAGWAAHAHGRTPDGQHSHDCPGKLRLVKRPGRASPHHLHVNHLRKRGVSPCYACPDQEPPSPCLPGLGDPRSPPLHPQNRGLHRGPGACRKAGWGDRCRVPGKGFVGGAEGAVRALLAAPKNTRTLLETFQHLAKLSRKQRHTHLLKIQAKPSIPLYIEQTDIPPSAPGQPRAAHAAPRRHPQHTPPLPGDHHGHPPNHPHDYHLQGHRGR